MKTFLFFILLFFSFSISFSLEKKTVNNLLLLETGSNQINQALTLLRVEKKLSKQDEKVAFKLFTVSFEFWKEATYLTNMAELVLLSSNENFIEANDIFKIKAYKFVKANKRLLTHNFDSFGEVTNKDLKNYINKSKIVLFKVLDILEAI